MILDPEVLKKYPELERLEEYVLSKLRDLQPLMELSMDDLMQVSPDRLNLALAEHSQVNQALAGEHQRLETAEYVALQEREDWYSEVYLQAREQMQSTMAKSVKISKDEIEKAVRVEHTQALRDFDDRAFAYRSAKDFIKQTMRNWQEHGDRLDMLSHNSRSEMRALTLQNRINSSLYKQVMGDLKGQVVESEGQIQNVVPRPPT